MLYASWEKGKSLMFTKMARSRPLFFTVSKYVRLCRSYGSVYKALHKESGQVLAIKQVPVDTDLQEIIKEISIMQQCDSPYVVKYYGSYFKNTDLWVSWCTSLYFTILNKLDDLSIML